MNSSYTYFIKSAIIFVSLYSLLVSGFSDATKNKTRIVGRHVHFFYQLESLVFSSFDNIREVPYPPSRVSAFQALVEIPVDIKNRKNAKPNATIKEMRNETKRAHKRQLILLLILDELTRLMARRFRLACMVHSSIDILHHSRLKARAIVLPPLSSIPG